MNDILPVQNTNKIRYADFFRLTTPTGIYLFSTAPYAITVPSIAAPPFAALGQLVQVNSVQRDIKSTASETTVTLVGIDTTMLGIVLAEKIKGSQIELWHGFFDSSNQLITATLNTTIGWTNNSLGAVGWINNSLDVISWLPSTAPISWANNSLVPIGWTNDLLDAIAWAGTGSTSSGLYQYFNGYVNTFSISEEWMEEARAFVGAVTLSASSFQLILQNRTAGRYTNDASWTSFTPADTAMNRVNFVSTINYAFGKDKPKQFNLLAGFDQDVATEGPG